MEGIEPPTFRMRSGRSTTELHPRRLIIRQKMFHKNVSMYKYVEFSYLYPIFIYLKRKKNRLIIILEMSFISLER